MEVDDITSYHAFVSEEKAAIHRPVALCLL